MGEKNTEEAHRYTHTHTHTHTQRERERERDRERARAREKKMRKEHEQLTAALFPFCFLFLFIHSFPSFLFFLLSHFLFFFLLSLTYKGGQVDHAAVSQAQPQAGADARVQGLERQRAGRRGLGRAPRVPGPAAQPHLLQRHLGRV